ncbi:hypothetical protein [Cupriavidus alkaliphilus]|uniref:hypothetical protein n=1 Tax=Cupriavidus alkaliphilus TaxID=942866 RepID=UPI000815E8D6|nr:hypothetical protein [Cupriavidus alkaliphilus]SCB10158.1 hypothetical protein GA0116996_101626 [Cupriavidus alkaliphilus]
MPNAVPPAAAYQRAYEAQQRAGGGHALPAVREISRMMYGNPHFEFRGTDEDQVYAAALDRKNLIDPYRSPAVVGRYRDGIDYVVVVRAFNLD